MQGRRKIGTIEIMNTINEWSDLIKGFMYLAYNSIKSPNEAIDRLCRYRLYRREGQLKSKCKVTIKGFGTDDVPWTKKAPAYVKVVL